MVSYAKYSPTGEDMKDETERLASFDSWPTWAAKRPINLAENGFYYTGVADAVRCFSCGGEIENWTCSDDVNEEHRRRFPTCPFIRGTVEDKKLIGESKSTEATCDSIDTTTNLEPRDDLAATEELLMQLSSFSDHNQADSHLTNMTKSISGKAQNINHNPMQLCYEDYRRQTFVGNWPENSLVSPVELAKAGFYYVGPEDMVRCAFCRGKLLNWKPTDVPMSEHKKHYPYCPFVKEEDIGNVPTSSIKAVQQAEKPKNHSPSERLGVILDKPKHPQYAMEMARLNSFKNWTKTSIAPDELVKAGFFYIGFSDNVKCFFCDGGLHNWEELDNPWVEHARWFPDCGYVKLCRRENSIKSVFQQNQDPAQAATVASTEKKPADPKVNPQQIAAWMNNADVETIISMGFSSSLVKSAIEKNVKRTGVYFTTTEELLEAVLQEHELANAEMKKSRKGRRKKKNKNKKKKKSIGSAAGEANDDNHNEEEEEEEEESPELEEILNLSSTEDEELKELVALLKQLKKERTCKLCMDEECSIVFLPCGHLVCCPSCAPALRHCPICRALIKGSVRAYFP